MTFRHNTNERNNTNVLKLRMKYGAAGYGVYMMLLERLADEPQLRSELDYDVLAFDFQVDATLIRHVVEDFDLFIIDLDGEFFYHEELTAQLNTKSKREKQEKLLDEFIHERLATPRWIENVALSKKTTPDRVRAITQTTFRAHILAKYPRVPAANQLLHLLFNYITQALLNEK